MSRTIDEKVVEMRFDNQNFESNVAQSMSTLDRLKNALNFSGVENVFSGISSAADKVNFNGLSNALEGVTGKFSALETVAVGALMNIGNKISDYLTNQLKGLTLDQVTAGFGKYESKTKAVQTIMAATGMEIDEVSAQLERLNWYTDETSYSFEDMVNNIGKFTSNGVELEKAVTAMEGISNLAAVSGQGKAEAARAMYNLSQALSSGSVMVRDWMSIENANMATKEFKEMVIQAAVAEGTLKEFYDDTTGEKFYATWAESVDGITALTEVNFKNMRETLKEKWFDDKVLINVLNTYGGFSDKLSEAYDEINSIEGVDVTTSEIIALTNQWIDHSIDMQEAMAITGQSAEDLERILSELGSEEYALGRKAFAAAQEAKTFGDAIDATKDAVSTGIMNVFEQLFGNYEEARVLWTDLANELWEIFAGPVSDLNDMLKAWNRIEMPDGTIIKGRDVFIQSVKDIYHAIRSVVDPITEAWESIFPPMDFQTLFDLTQRFQDFTSTLELSEETIDVLRTSFEKIFGVIKYTIDGVKELAGAFANSFFAENDGGFFKGIIITLEEVASVIGTIVHAFQNISEAYVKAIDDGTDATKRVIDGYKKAHPVVYNLVDIFYKLKDSLSIAGEYFGKLLSLNDLFVYYGEAGEGLAGIINIIVFKVRDTLNAIKDLVKVWTGIDLTEPFGKAWEVLLGFERKLEELQADGIFDSIKEKFFGIFDAFEERFGSIVSWFKPLGDALMSIWNDFFGGLDILLNNKTASGFSKAMSSIFIEIDKSLDNIIGFIKNSPMLEKIIDVMKNSISAYADFLSKFLSFKEIVDVFTYWKDAQGVVSGVVAVVLRELRLLFDYIADSVQRVTGLDLHGFADDVSLVFTRIFKTVITTTGYVKEFINSLKSNTNFKDSLIEIKDSFVEIKDKFFALFDSFEDRFGSIIGWFKPLGDAFTHIWEDLFSGFAIFSGGGESDGIKGFFSIISSGLDAANEFINNSSKLEAIVNSFKGIIQDVADFLQKFLSVKDTIQTFKDAGGGFSGVIAVIVDKLKDVYNLVADVVQRITGFDIHSIEDKVLFAFGAIVYGVKTAIAYVKSFIGTVSSLFKDFAQTFNDAGGGVSGTSAVITDIFKRIFDLIADGIQKLTGFDVRGMINKIVPIFDTISTTVKDIIGNIKDFVSSAIGYVNSLVQVFRDAGGGFSGISAVISTILNDIYNGIANGIQSLTGFDIRSLEDKVVPVFRKIGEFIKSAIEHVKNFIALFRPDNTKDIDEFGNTVETKLTPLQTFFAGLKNFFSGLVDAFKSFKPIFDVILEKIGYALGTIGDSLKNAFKNADFGTVMDWLSKGIGIALKIGIAKIVLSLKGIVGDILDLFDSISGLFGGAKKKLDGGDFSDFLLKTAAAIGIITVSLIALSGVDGAGIAKSLGAITGVLADLVGAIALNNVVSSKTGVTKANDMAGQVLTMSAALLIASISLKKLSKIEWDHLKDALLAMTIALGEMVAASILIDKFGSSSGGKTAKLTAMATSMVIVAAALKIIGGMEWEEIKDGLAGMGLALTELTLSIIAIDKFGSSNGNAGTKMLAMVAAVGILALVLKGIAAMGWDTISTGLAGMGLALAEVTIAMIALNQFGGNGIITAVGFAAMAAALLLLVAPIEIFARLSLEEIGKSLLVMAGAFLIIGGLGSIFGGFALQILGFAASIAVMGAALILLVPSLELLGNMSLSEIVKGLLAIAGVFAVVGVAGLLLGPISPLILALAAAVALLGVAVLGIGAGLMLFASGLAILSEVGSAGIDVLVEAIIRIVEVIPLLLSKVAEGVVSAIKTLLGILPSLLGDIVNAIGEFILKAIDFVKEHKTSFGEAFINIVDTILDTVMTLIPKIANVLVTLFDELLKIIAEHSDSIIDSVATIIVNVLNGIADHLPEFIEAGINLVLSLIEGLGEGISNNAERARDAFTKLFDGIIEAVLIFLGIDRGEAEKFVDIAGEMIGGLISGITQFAMDAFKAIGEFMTDLVDKVREGLPEFLDRGKEIIDNIIEGITSKIEDAVEAIKSAINAIIEGATAVIDKAKDIGKSIVDKIKGGTEDPDAQKTIQDTGKNLALGVKEGLEKATSSASKAAGKVVDTVVDTMKKVGGIHSPSEVTKEEVGNFLGLGVGRGLFESIPDVAKTVMDFMDNVVDGMTTDEVASLAKDAGLDLGGYFGIGLESFLKDEDFAFDDYIDAIDTDTLGELLAEHGIDGALLKTNEAKEAGNILTEAGVEGALENTDDAKDAADTVVSAGVDTVMDGYSDYVDASETSSAGIVDGLASYGKGGKNEDKTEAATDAVVDKVVDSIEDDDGKMRSAGEKEAEEWQEGFLESGGWDTLSDEIKEKLGGALSGLYGYKLDEEGALRRVNKSGEYVDFEEVPGSVITWSGTQGTIKSYVQNGVTGYNSSGSYSVASAAAAQNAMNRNLYNSEYVRSGDDEDDRIYQEVKKLNENMAEYNENITNMQIVMDTGVVAGEVSPAVNQNLGKTSWYSSRGI